MFCKNCGCEVSEGTKFCAKCGAPVGNPPQGASPAQNIQQTAPAQPAYPIDGNVGTPGVPPKKKTKVWLIILIIAGAVLTLSIIVGAVVLHFARKAANEYIEDFEDQYEEMEDIDLDSLEDAVDNLENLDLGSDTDSDTKSDTSPDFDFDEPDDNEPAENAGSEGALTKYSYADVTTNGTDINVVPNGGLNGSTRLFNGNDKDLNGFLDYVDSDVLEKGRVINRDFFYGMLACMLVDKDLISDKDSIERNMIMALAMANNFHDMKVEINSCDLDANNAEVYRYHVTAYDDKDDIWVVNYNESTVFFNDGKTEYHSTMFEHEYLAVWMVAIEEYYGLN